MRFGNRARTRHHDREHRQVEALLSEYLDGALLAQQCELVEAHARGCARCHATILSPTSTTRMLRSLKTDTPASPALIAGIIARLASANAGEEGNADDPLPADVEEPRASREVAASEEHRSLSRLHPVRAALAACIHPSYLRRTVPITVIAGLALTAIYQLNDLLDGRAQAGTYLMCACNFAVAFVLISLGPLIATSIARRRRPPDRGPR